jgi:hypothetical protein
METGFAVGGAELLDELADQWLGGVGREAAGVAGGVEDVEEELGEALAVFRSEERRVGKECM